MKYQVIGSNRETGARMVLEFEAESKAAAERKATQSGMSVNRVQDITDGHPSHAQPAADYRPVSKGKSNIVMPMITLAVLALVLFLMRDQILTWIHSRAGGH